MQVGVRNLRVFQFCQIRPLFLLTPDFFILHKKVFSIVMSLKQNVMQESSVDIIPFHKKIVNYFQWVNIVQKYFLLLYFNKSFMVSDIF